MNAAALAARAIGISVCPPLQSTNPARREKRPRCDFLADDGESKTWSPLQIKPADDALFKSWYGSCHGLGFICGAVSGNLVALDFDLTGLYESFVERAMDWGLDGLVKRVSAGYSSATAGGGHHVLFFAEEPYGSIKLALRPAPTGKDSSAKKTLIETKGEGGFIIEAPTFGDVHPSGKPYVLLRGSVETIASVTAEEYEDLCVLAKSFDEIVEEKTDKAERPTASAPKRSEGLRPGDDYDQRHTWDDVLTGWTRVYMRGDTTYWRRPDKSSGVSASTNHEGTDRLKVFTTSSQFDIKGTYSKFEAYTLLHHGGEFTLAAKSLGSQGYGEQRQNGTRNGPPAGPRLADLPDQGDEDGPSADVVDRWPVLDPAAFYGLAGDFVRMARPHTEADDVAMLAQFLTATGNAMSKGPHLRIGASYHPPILNMGLTGVTSGGRKGSSYAAVSYPLSLMDPEWHSHRIRSGLVSGEGLIHNVRDATYDEEGEVKDAGEPDKRLLVVEEEMSRVLKSMNRDNNTLSEVIRKGWDCPHTLAVLAKNSPDVATHARISIICHVTVADLRVHFNAKETANGFGNRFLWICARKSKDLPDGGDFFDVDWGPLAERMKAACEHSRGIGPVRRDPLASEIWRERYPELNRERPGLLGAMLGRAAPQVLRIALVYALLDGSREIRADHLVPAFALWDYAEASARCIFGDDLGDAKADKLMKALQEASNGLTRTQITREVFRNNVLKAALGSLLTDMLSGGLIHRAGVETVNGHEVERWKAGRQPRVTN